MDMLETIVLDGASVRRTASGYLVATAKSARTGIQVYKGREIGRPDLEQVRVFRPESEVFSRDSMHSFAHKPMTLGHPKEAVTSKNWKEHSVGIVGDEIARDGEFVRVPLTLMDERAIDAVDRGLRELSWGYTCDMDWTPGKTDDGQDYDAKQTNIRANHLAVVGVARGGAELKIGDEAVTKKILVDGFEVEVTDAAERVIQKLQGVIDENKSTIAAKDGEIGTLKAKVATQDGTIAALNKQVSDAASPAALDARVAARARVVDAARRIAPAITVDGKSDADIKRAVVVARLADAAKDMNDAAVDGAFAVLAADGATSSGVGNILPSPSAVADAAAGDAAWNKANQQRADRWKAQN